MKYQISIKNKALPKFIRRNRRLIAAICAALATLILSSTLTKNDNQSIQSDLTIPEGKSAISIEISSELMGSVIAVGKQVDLISVDDGAASMIADSAQILRIGNSNSRLGGNVTEVLIAISLFEATKVAAANQAGSIQVLISEPN